MTLLANGCDGQTANREQQMANGQMGNGTANRMQCTQQRQTAPQHTYTGVWVKVVHLHCFGDTVVALGTSSHHSSLVSYIIRERSHDDCHAVTVKFSILLVCCVIDAIGRTCCAQSELSQHRNDNLRYN